MTNQATSGLFGSGRVLQIYKSGFLGAPVNQFKSRENRTKLESVNGIMHQLTVLGDDPHALKTNPHIDAVYNTMLTQGAHLTRFAFLDDVLSTFLEVSQFPGTYLDWAFQQANSPCLTKTHMDFLADSLNFAFTGQRQLSLNSWSHVLKHANIQMIEGEYKANPQDIRRELAAGRLASWVDLIQSWVSQEGGLKDLVQTMWIIYGSGIPSK